MIDMLGEIGLVRWLGACRNILIIVRIQGLGIVSERGAFLREHQRAGLPESGGICIAENLYFNNHSRHAISSA